MYLVKQAAASAHTRSVGVGDYSFVTLRIVAANAFFFAMAYASGDSYCFCHG